MSQFIAICAEQDRLRTLFVSEVSRSLGGTVRRAAGRINNPLAAHCDDGYSRKSSTVEQIVRKFEKTMVRKKSCTSVAVYYTFIRRLLCDFISYCSADTTALFQYRRFSS